MLRSFCTKSDELTSGQMDTLRDMSELCIDVFGKYPNLAAKSGQIDHLRPLQIDHLNMAPNNHQNCWRRFHYS
ncbi:MAG: hypothetical protein V9E90_11535 [Saprospiraceae bacterium]